MEIYVFNQHDELLTILSEETGLLSAPFRERLNEIDDTPLEITVDVTVEYEQQYDERNNLMQVAGAFVGTLSSGSRRMKKVSAAEHIKDENRLVFYNREKKLKEYVIKEVEDNSSVDEATVTAICIPAWIDELNDNYVLDKRYTNKQAIDALKDALENTRYTGEVVGSLGNASTSFYKLTSAKCIFEIRDAWGGDIDDVIELNELGRIKQRKIIIRQRLGADKGGRFEVGHNVNNIKRTILSYPKTALYGWGASLQVTDEDGNETGGHTRYIDFGEVEWSVEKGDPIDKPKGQKWVGSEELLLKYGRKYGNKLLHREGEFNDQNIEDDEELLKATYNQLVSGDNGIEVNYELDVELIDEDAQIGDTVVAMDHNFPKPIMIQARIIAIEYDLLDMDDATVQVGSFLDLADKRIDNIKETIDSNRGKWENPIINSDNFPDVIPKTPTNTRADGLFKNIIVSWDYDENVYISHFEVYGSRITGFSPSEQHLLYRGKTSSFVHEANTDELWYYRIRAVNLKGKPSGFSGEISTSTVRITTPDMLHGSVTAELLENNLNLANKLSDETFGDISQNIDIEGDIHIVEGTAIIQNGVVGTLAIADAAISRAHLQDAIIGNAQIENGTITNKLIANDAAIDFAKIANVEITNAMIVSVKAEKIDVDYLSSISANIGDITAGNIKGVDIVGSTLTSYDNATNDVVVIETGKIEFFEDGEMTARLSPYGQQFYRDEIYVGHIGATNVVNRPDYRGLRFGLEGDAQYMAWSYRTAEGGIYSVALTWDRKGELYTKGFNFSDDVRINTGNRLSLRRLSTTSYSGGDRELEFVNHTNTLNGVESSGAAFKYEEGSDSSHMYISPKRTGMLVGGGNTGIIVDNDTGVRIYGDVRMDATSVFKIRQISTTNFAAGDRIITYSNYKHTLYSEVKEGVTLYYGTGNNESGILFAGGRTGLYTNNAKITLDNSQGIIVVGETFFDGDVYVHWESSLKVHRLKTTNNSPRIVTLDNYSWDGLAGVHFAYGVDGQGGGLWVGSARAALISSGNAYIQVTQDSTGNAVQSKDIYNRRYDFSSNVYVTSYGTLGRITSARKYKLLEEEMKINPYDILKIVPKTWYNKDAVEVYASLIDENGECDLTDEDIPKIERVPGAIADDFADAGLGIFVVRDDDGEIESLMYDRAWLPLIPVTNDHEQRLNEYDKRFGTIESRIEALENEIEKLKGVA